MTDVQKELLGSNSGVAVVQDGEVFQVAFAIDREMVRRIKEVEGAEFDKEQGVWTVPVSEQEALTKAVEGMRFESAAIDRDRADIETLAHNSAAVRMKAHGAEKGVEAKIAPVYTKEPTVGEIINVNGRFAAQLTGFGNENGAAFVSIHRVADLKEPVMKGDKVRIAYGEHGLAEVSDRSHVKTMDEQRKDFENTLGKEFQGVTVTYGEDFQVAFDYNPEMKERLQKIADVTFDKDANVFVVPGHLRDNLVRAVSDMRRDFVADNQERAQLISLAETKMDGAQVRNAFTKDGLAHYGKVVDVSDRYVLQHGGKNEFKLHRRDSLDHKDVQKDQSLKITYDKGRGKVEDRNKERQNDGLAR